MKYISIGAVLKEGTEHILDVAHGGAQFRLTGDKASLWLNGRLGFADVFNPAQLVALEQLYKMGLVIKCDGSGAQEYRALTKCTIVPAECDHPYWFLRDTEKTVLQWLRNAGLVLSMNFVKTAPVTSDMKVMSFHYQVVEALFTCLVQERQFGVPANDALKKQRDTALQNLQTVVNSFRKQFQSFKPATPEAYCAAVTKMVNTILPAWLQYRFTYIPF